MLVRQANDLGTKSIRFLVMNTMMHAFDGYKRNPRGLKSSYDKSEMVMRSNEECHQVLKAMRGILLIPFKSLATAKQRLAEALDARQRQSSPKPCCAT